LCDLPHKLANWSIYASISSWTLYASSL